MTTITTVGFGDISAGTTAERLICVTLMVIGVVSFSFATGTLSSILSNLDSSRAKVKEKFGILSELKKDYELSNTLYDELRHALKFDNHRLALCALLSILGTCKTLSRSSMSCHINFE